MLDGPAEQRLPLRQAGVEVQDGVPVVLVQPVLQLRPDLRRLICHQRAIDAGQHAPGHHPPDARLHGRRPHAQLPAEGDADDGHIFRSVVVQHCAHRLLPLRREGQAGFPQGRPLAGALKSQHRIAALGQVQQGVGELLQQGVVAAMEQDCALGGICGHDPPAGQNAVRIGHLLPVDGAALLRKQVGKVCIEDLPGPVISSMTLRGVRRHEELRHPKISGGGRPVLPGFRLGGKLL